MVNRLGEWDCQLFGLTNTRAVALTFSDSRPPGLLRHPAPQPSGCTFWKLAAEESVFYTEASDHFGCPVGACTLGAELPEAEAQELRGHLSTMVRLSYVTEQEVAQLPRRTAPLRYVIYAPLGLTPIFPDLVLVRGNMRQLMLLSETARAAGRFQEHQTLGRPACAIVPASLACNKAVLSLGCIGNRVYTSLGEDEGYIAIPGSALQPIFARLTAILKANEALADFHYQRQLKCTTTA
jgi:uncharacterized protein (DUF169 family)